jgi:hypothetical protein
MQYNTTTLSNNKHEGIAENPELDSSSFLTITNFYFDTATPNTTTYLSSKRER